jgi:hypothetical protein
MAGAWNGPATVTIESGVITDPGNTPATAADCLPYACFADGGANTGARAWCAWYGQMNSYNTCENPVCAPYRSTSGLNCPSVVPAPTTPPFPVTPPIYAPLPKATTQTTPSITQTALNAYGASQPASKAINPRSLVPTLPSIVAAPMQEPQVQACDSLAGWVGQNPLLAVGALVGLYFLVKG